MKVSVPTVREPLTVTVLVNGAALGGEKVASLPSVHVVGAAVPVLSFLAITIEEFWIKPMEDADRSRAREGLELPDGVDEEDLPDQPTKEPFALEEVVER